MFKRCLLALGVVLLAWGVGGCKSGEDEENMMPGHGSPGDNSGAVEFSTPPGRMVEWEVSLTVLTDDVDSAATQAVKLVEHAGGYMERKSSDGDKSVDLRFKVPTKGLDSIVGVCEALGTVESRSIGAEDVTEQYVDVEARLKTLVALRDRLKKLLDKADAVKDVLLVEREFSRVQSAIESIEARLKSLKAKTDMATVYLTLRRERVLGPFGWFFYGLWWGTKSLFVIQ